MDVHERRFLMWRILSAASAAGAGLVGCQPDAMVHAPLLTPQAARVRPEPKPPTEHPEEMPATVPVPVVRPVRALVVEGAGQFRVSIDGPYVVLDDQGRVVARGADLPWTLVRASSGVLLGTQRVGSRSARLVPERPDSIQISTLGNTGAWSPSLRFDGQLHCLADGARVSAINVVPIDSYLAGVIPRECYPSWHLETFRAQAVAARTYALYEMARTGNEPFDVRATTASQVYGGVPAGEPGRRAQQAVESTRGIVLTWTTPAGERIFPTFFSAACGGMTQDAGNCKPIKAVPPLTGGVPCDYCQIAGEKAYRWGPLRLSKAEITTKLAQRYPAMASLGRVERIEALSQTSFGRNVRLRVFGSRGASFDIQAEDFRLAIGPTRLKSTDCRIVSEKDAIVFSDGRGYGHAMGMCQWGAQGQALEGRRAGQILLTYYPGANLTRVY